MQKRILKRTLFLIFGILLLAPLQPITAQENSGLSLSYTFGFDGTYKVGYWFPIQVELSNSGPSIEGELLFEAGDSGDSVRYSAPLSLPTQSNKVIELTVNVDRLTNQALVVRSDDGTVLLREPITRVNVLPGNGLLYGVVSSDGGELAYLESLNGAFSQAGVAFLDIEDLPETAVPWANLDVLIFNDIDSSQLSSNQLFALQQWIESGGQFVVTGGNGWEQTATAVSDLLPVTLTGSQTVDDLPQFNQQVAVPFRDPGPYLLTTSSIRSGELLFHDDGLPILATQRLGRGYSYFLALDPRSAPLIDWDGTESLWMSIINRAPQRPLWQLPIRNSNSAVSAVSSLPDFNLPAVWQLMAFLGAYVLLIGPVNYFILKRRNQLDRAWLTIPVMVLIFSVGTYLVGANIRGSEAIVNQLSVAFSRANGEQAEVQTLVGLYAPQRGNYDLSVPEGVAIRPLTSGFSNFTGGAPEKITLSSETSVNDLRLDVGEIATFATQSVQPAIRIDGQATLESDGDSVRLNATILNNSDLTLENGLLLFGNIGLDIGEIQPGSSEQVDTLFTQTMLSRNGFVTGGGTSFNPGNNPLSNNIEVILGGFNYYSDPVLYPRWELIQSIENQSVGSEDVLNQLTFVFWTEQSGVDVAISRNKSELGVMLHFVEIPLTANIIQQDVGIIPPAFLEWTTLESTNVFSSEPIDMSFSGNSIMAFEFTPVLDFQTMPIDELTIALDVMDTTEPAPEVYLWDWEREVWAILEDADWGDTAVSDFEPYINNNNAIRIRLVDQSDFGIFINSVYPIMTGELDVDE
ncbi:MAG: hypothetical protein AAF490_22385 [Chloroflexota bacterium]